MHRTRINQLRHRHLLDPPQPLVIRMPNDRKDQRVIDGDKTMNGIIDDLSLDWRHPVAELLNQTVAKKQKYE
jgi:hypothetical protein